MQTTREMMQEFSHLEPPMFHELITIVSDSYGICTNDFGWFERRQCGDNEEDTQREYKECEQKAFSMAANMAEQRLGLCLTPDQAERIYRMDNGGYNPRSILMQDAMNHVVGLIEESLPEIPINWWEALCIIKKARSIGKIDRLTDALPETYKTVTWQLTNNETSCSVEYCRPFNLNNPVVALDLTHEEWRLIRAKSQCEE